MVDVIMALKNPLTNSGLSVPSASNNWITPTGRVLNIKKHTSLYLEIEIMQSDRDKTIKSSREPLRIAPYSSHDVGMHAYGLICVGVKDRATVNHCLARMRRDMEVNTCTQKEN